LPDVDLIAIVETEADAFSRIPICLPHVLILDLHLRSSTGFGVLRSTAHDHLMWPKVVVLTSFSQQEYRREAEALGADVFLDKSRDYLRLPGLLSDFAKALRNESAP
jgi:DNA-binding NarL/FixJ family response regulator